MVGGITVIVTVGAGVALSVGKGSVALGEPSFGFGWASVAVEVGFGVGLAEEDGFDDGFGVEGFCGFTGVCGLVFTWVTVGSSLGAVALGEAEVWSALGAEALGHWLWP